MCATTRTRRKLLGRTAIAAIIALLALCLAPTLAIAQEDATSADDGPQQLAIQAGNAGLITAQDDSETPQYHVQTTQVQGNNGTTLESGPNFVHVPTTYTYDLNKDDYPVPYGGNGIPLANGLANYLQACGIFFPGDKLKIISQDDPNPRQLGYHGLPGLCLHDGKGSYGDYEVGDRIGPLEVTGTVTKGNMATHPYITELTVVDAPVMFSTGSGNSGASSWATSDPDEKGYPQNWWSVSSIRYVELPKYHPVVYRYFCNGAEIPAADLAHMEFYDNKPANPSVIWAEDLSVAFVPYVTWGTQWESNKSGAEFTFSRPFIEGYAFESMSIGANGDNFWAWEPTYNEDGQTYTSRFRYSGDMDYNWTLTNQKEGSESDPIVVTFNYTRTSNRPSTMTIDANGGTINGRAKWMYNYYSDIYLNSAFQQDNPPIPTHEGRVFDGWYKDAACTQIISPSAENATDLGGSSMSAYRMQSYVEVYGSQLFNNQDAKHFTIYAKWAPSNAKTLSDLDISGISAKTYTGNAITQTPVIKDGTKTLVAGTDYQILGYENNVDSTSSAKVIIGGIGNYRGVVVKTFAINRKPVTINFDIAYTSSVYDGTWQKPDIKNFTCSEPGLTLADNFYTSYSNNCYPSTETSKARVTISATGNYEGSAAREFTIAPRAIKPTIQLGYAKTTYTGEAQCPSVTVKDGDTQLSSSYYTTTVSDNTNVGTATVTVELKGNYAGQASATFEIVSATKSFSIALDEASYTDRVYDDWYKRPSAIVKAGTTTLTEGTHYLLEYKGNRNAGTATITAVGIGAYAGYTGATTFVIEPLDLGTITSMYTTIHDMRYTGKAVTPKPTLNVYADSYMYLYPDEDYTATYANNVNVGTATMTIAGKGNFKGTATLEFNIVKKDDPIVDISSSSVRINSLGSYTYTGKPIEVVPSIVYNGTYLTRGVDFDASWENNVNPGEATVHITGMGDFSGTTTTTFTITPSSGPVKSANTLTAKAAKTTQTLTYSAAKAQTITTAKAYVVSNAKGAVSYKKKSGNTGITVAANGTITVKKGLAFGSYPITVTVTAAGNDNYLASSKNVSFTVAIAKAASTIKLAAQSKTYNGKAQAYTGKVTRTGSNGKVTYKYYSDAKCTKAVSAAKVKTARVYYVKATVAANNNYKAATSAAAKFTITKAANPIKVKALKPKVAYSKTKQRTLAAKAYCTVTKAQGKVTYKKASGNKNITVATNGKITVKKGLKKGAYTLKITVKAAGNTNYKAKNTKITVKLTVK